MKIENYGFAKDHHPKSEKIYKFISDLDFENGDYFCFKDGGDADNGEFLMDLLDAYFRPRCSCEFCRDLRNIQPAKYLGGGDEIFKEWISEARKEKKFILLGENFFETVDECPVCGHVFTEGEYDEY